MRLQRSIVALLAVAVAVAFAAPGAWGAKAPKKSKKRHFELRYVPTETLQASPCSGGAKIAVRPLGDSRADKSLLGENREKDTPQPVTTDSDVAAHVTEALVTELSGNGCVVVADASPRWIEGEVTAYRVTLEGTYKAQAAITLRVTDASGAKLWSGSGRGDATRFSMLESPENYLQTLSDAVSSAFSDALDDPELAAILAK